MTTFILHKLAPLWGHGIHGWAQILGRGPDGRPYFIDDREIQWANPTMSFPLPQRLNHALKYLRTRFSSKNDKDWRGLKTKISGPMMADLSIALR